MSVDASRRVERSASVRGIASAARAVAVLAMLAVCVSVVAPEQADGSVAAGVRDELTRDELLEDDPSDVQLVDNAAFLPAAGAGPERQTIEGRLTVPRTAMQLGDPAYSSYRWFPGFSVDFFSHNGVLAPVERSLIVTPGNWTLILSPGRIWSELGDGAMSRASFPFVLASPPDRTTAGGEAHNGVATFLIGAEGTSSLRFR